MPGRDGTGPMGMGPLTGRGAGFCAGSATRPMFKLGFRKMYYSGYNGIDEPVVDQKELLSSQAKFLENQLQQVKKRLSDYKEDEE